MKILEFYYNENYNTLMVDFSMDIDGDNFFRQSILELSDIEYYSPTIINKSELKYLDEDTIIDILTGYLIDNDLPEQVSL